MESETKNRSGRGAMLLLLVVALGVAAAALIGGWKADTGAAGPGDTQATKEPAPGELAGRGAAGQIVGAELPKPAAANDAAAPTGAGTRAAAGGIDAGGATGGSAADGPQAGATAALLTTPASVADDADAKGSVAGGAQPAQTDLKLDTEFASAKRIVPFAFNRVGVGPQGGLAVRELLPLAKQAQRVYVRGRTDSRGDVSANRQVALNRAYAVRTAFVSGGVAPSKVRISYCASCFIASNDTEDGRRANRRVDVELIMPAEEIAKLPKPVHAREYPGGSEGRLALAPAMSAPAAQAAAR